MGKTLKLYWKIVCAYREPEASCFQVFLLLYVLVVGEKDSEDGIYIPSVFSLSSRG